MNKIMDKIKTLIESHKKLQESSNTFTEALYHQEEREFYERMKLFIETNQQ